MVKKVNLSKEQIMDACVNYALDKGLIPRPLSNASVWFCCDLKLGPSDEYEMTIEETKIMDLKQKR